METQFQQNKAVICFNQIQLFIIITDFVNLPEVLKISLLNKQFRQLVQQRFQNILYDQGHIQQKQNTTDFNVDYHQLYKYFHNRELLYCNILQPFQKDTITQDLKVYRNRKQGLLAGKAIKDYQLGQKFSVFLTHSKLLIITFSHELLSLNNCQIIQKNSVKSFSVSGRDLFYLKENGEVYVVFFEENLALEKLKECCLEWSKIGSVETMQVSYSFGLFILKDSDEREKMINYQLMHSVCEGKSLSVYMSKMTLIELNEYKTKMKDITKRNILFFNIKDLEAQDTLNKLRYRTIEGYPTLEINSICMGYDRAYLLTDNRKVMELDLNNSQQQQVIQEENEMHTIYLKENLNFTNRNFVSLYSGLNFYFAIERQQSEFIEFWDSGKVIQFFTSISLSDYNNIIKYQNISGKDLLQFDKDFIKDTMGMEREDHLAKLQYEINREKQKSVKTQQLYAWGKNDQCQLGINGSNAINKPQKVKFPELEIDDYIVDIRCSWKKTLILTKNNRLFINDFLTKKDTLDQDSEQEQQEKYNTNKRGRGGNNRKEKGGGKRYKKHSEEQVQNKHLIAEDIIKTNNNNNKYLWIEITKVFSKLKDQRKYKIVIASSNQEFLSVLGVCYDTKIMAKLRQLQKMNGFEIQEFYHLNLNMEKKKNKMKGPSEIIDRIRWDQQLKIQEFSVVYEDRFMGNIEVPLEEFIHSEAKNHRVRQFKKQSQILWDKDKRIDLFKDLFD